MKSLLPFLLILVISLVSIDTNAQFKNLGKRIKRKIDQRIDRKFDRGIDKGLDKAESGIDDTVTGEGKNSEGNQTPETQSTNGGGNPDTNSTGNVNNDGVATVAATTAEFQVNTKFDYVPGEALMVFEDFSDDALGDFPARWNTDGTGEVVTFGASNDKWFQMKSGSDYIPDLPRELPESYTIEFDLAARGIDKKTSSAALLEIILDDNNQFRRGPNFVWVRIPFCQYHPIGFQIRNVVDRKSVIHNTVQGDIRQQVLNQPHVSIAVNKTRLRLWINEKKYVDIPRLVPLGNTIKYLKLRPYSFKDGKEDIYIRNLKIAEGGLDLRSQLLKEGKVSTNGILFDVNSANIKPESYGVIRQIALALEESDMNLNIIGHTDSDGSDDDNLDLSQRRAESVKAALVDDFGIVANRLTVEGKGETEPVAENNRPEEKAANRRVEFVSL